jgi:hypothetical protein
MNIKKKIIKPAVIAFSVFFLATIINVGINFYTPIAYRNARLQGNTAHVEVLIGSMTPEQAMNVINNLNWQLDYIKTSYTNSYLGQVTNSTQGIIEIFPAVPFSMDEWTKILRPAYTNITGRYPEARNEIMASRYALELLGIDNPKIGMEIEISYDLYDVGIVSTQTFTLSGFFTDYTNLAERPTRIFCSRPFTDAARMSVMSEENKEALRAANAKHGMLVLFESGGSLEANIEKLKRGFGLTDEQIIITPAFSGEFDGISANLFALDFYPAIYIGAAVLAVIVIAVSMITNAKKAKKLKGSAK